MDNKPREDYGVEDFLTDESFANYHLHLNIKDQLLWQEWLINHPEKRAIVKQAGDILQTLSLTISDKEFLGELEKMKAAINIKAPQRVFSLINWTNKSAKPRRSKRRILYLVAHLSYYLVAFSRIR